MGQLIPVQQRMVVCAGTYGDRSGFRHAAQDATGRGEWDMRILEMITPSRIGGAEVHVVSLTKAFRNMQEDVLVFCPTNRPLIPYLYEHGITPCTWKTWGKIDPKTVYGLVRLIKREKIDILHAHLSSAAFIGSLAAHLAHIRCVATVHGFTFAGWYRFADRLFAVSEAVKENLLSQGIAEEKIRVIHNGIALERYTPQASTVAKLACGFNVATPRVGVFGRLTPVKGQAIVLQAWPLVRSRVPTARLMLVGEGKSENELRRMAAQLGVADSVEFHGFIGDPRALMTACDIITMPSISEGLGLAAMEAMALERPVVVSDAGGLVEVVTDGETGLVTPRGEPRPLAAALIRLLTDPQLAERLALAGRLRVKTHFSAAQQMPILRDALATEAQLCNERAAYT